MIYNSIFIIINSNAKFIMSLCRHPSHNLDPFPRQRRWPCGSALPTRTTRAPGSGSTAPRSKPKTGTGTPRTMASARSTAWYSDPTSTRLSMMQSVTVRRSSCASMTCGKCEAVLWRLTLVSWFNISLHATSVACLKLHNGIKFSPRYNVFCLSVVRGEDYSLLTFLRIVNFCATDMPFLQRYEDECRG